VNPLRYLDASRGGLALVVAVGHLAQIYDPAAHPAYGWLAYAAVLGFFAISGFVIAKSLKAHDWRQFAIRRADRLLPPFLFSVALCAVLWALAPLVFTTSSHALNGTARAAFSMDGLLPTLLFLNGFAGPTLDSNGPLWSLSYEVWYYAIAALAVYRQRAIAVLLLVVLTILQPWFAIKGLAFVAGFVAGWRGAERPSRQAGGLLAISGSFSYTLYLTHFPILLFCYGAGVPMLMAAAIAFGFAALVGPRLERVRVSRLVHHEYPSPTKPLTDSGVPMTLSINGVVVRS
jgi:peptidoglycan/LPS O-acetylase OafA/YrhL